MQLQCTLKMADGATFVSNFPTSTELNHELMAVNTLRKNQASHPLYTQWLKQRGNHPTQLVDGVLECLPEAIHTAMRKLCDSSQSVITWSAMYVLHAKDAKAFYASCKAFFEKMMPQGTHENRRNLAIDFRAHVLAFLDDHIGEVRVQERKRESAGAHERLFALTALCAAFKLTDIDEWSWGVLGYVLEDVPAVEESAEQEVAAISAGAEVVQ